MFKLSFIEILLDINLKQCHCFTQTMALFQPNNAVVLPKQCHCFGFILDLILYLLDLIFFKSTFQYIEFHLLFLDKRSQSFLNNLIHLSP